jgi:hypothetical protein
VAARSDATRGGWHSSRQYAGNHQTKQSIKKNTQARFAEKYNIEKTLHTTRRIGLGWGYKRDRKRECVCVWLGFGLRTSLTYHLDIADGSDASHKHIDSHYGRTICCVKINLSLVPWALKEILRAGRCMATRLSDLHHPTAFGAQYWESRRGRHHTREKTQTGKPLPKIDRK